MLVVLQEVRQFQVDEAYSNWGQEIDKKAASLNLGLHMYPFLLHKFRKLVAFIVMVATMLVEGYFIKN